MIGGWFSTGRFVVQDPAQVSITRTAFFHPHDAGRIVAVVFVVLEADEHAIYLIAVADPSGEPASPPET